MNRDQMLKTLAEATAPWDLIIIGGGATGLGVAVDAASRGYRTLLLEQGDFGKATSSRSTKLIHGGVRYLQQGNIRLVRESLRERGLLLENSPHLVHALPFVVPNYAWWEAPFYGIGLKVYDLLAGKLGLARSKNLSRDETLRRLPTLEPSGLRGGVLYYDGQFDDARLAIALARTAADNGTTLVNYVSVTSLLKQNGRVAGVVAEDTESKQVYELPARAVVNATGVFTDAIRRLDEPGAGEIISPSQGAHIVLPKSFLPGDTAIMVPRTDDGRVLFAIPWQAHVLVGTTDTPVAQPELEPRPLEQEVNFLLAHASRYLANDPEMDDVLSAFAGLRPLVKTGKTKNTSLVPRDHSLVISNSGLITITGGKWTTYRQMAQDTVDHVALTGKLPPRPCVTAKLRLRGWMNPEELKSLPDNRGGNSYGSDVSGLRALTDANPSLDELLYPALPYRAVEVIWAVRHEMARTLEDVLARRTRALILDARASIAMAPKVARLMAAELGRDEAWENGQVFDFRKLAQRYLLK